MYPVLFEFDTPIFLQGIFPDTITIYAYGFFIALGAIAGFIYTAYQAKKRYEVKIDTVQMLVIFIIIASVIGGKLFVVFENPNIYLKIHRS